MSGQRASGRSKSGALRPEVLPPEEDRRYYTRLRQRVERWAAGHAGSATAALLLAAPDVFVFLSRLARDARVSTKDKALLGAALAYFISPLDIVPEALLGPIAYVDDLALSAYVLNHFLNHVEPAIVSDHWPGRERAKAVIQKISKAANALLGARLWARVRRVLR
jgi:uncharacterized membrane protein YkvA (DUF1232 family)